MNKIFFTLLVALSTQGNFAQGNGKKVLFVIVDGISADVIEKIATPNLDIIAKEGGYTRAYVGGLKDGYSQTPTISAVGYNSLLTGTWANKHNVWGNSIVAPNYKYWTIFRFVKENKQELKIAIFSTWLDNRTKLVGENLSATGNIKLDYHFDGFEKDTLNFPHDKERLFIHKIDEHVVAETSKYIKKNAPDLSWVYLEYTDDMGHKFGDSEQFYKAVKIMDNQIGRLWQSLKYREKLYKENWEIYITTDHGRNIETGKGHGGQTERERLTWIVTNAKELNSYFKTKEPAIVDIMPTMLRSLNLKPLKAQLREIDGVPLTGKVSIVKPTAVLKENKLHINWEVLNKKGKVKIYISTTNNFSNGEKDNYIFMKKVKPNKMEAIIDVSKLKSSFYKIVLEGKYNTVNTWVINKI